jgi:D-alanine-D-alanine ligase
MVAQVGSIGHRKLDAPCAGDRQCAPGGAVVHIAVLMGGNSTEREVSLSSGQAVAAALAAAGHRVEAVDIPSVRAVADLAVVREVEVVFPALHGGEGEDGHLQALLDLLEVKYALSGPLASALAMDKAACKRIMAGAGIATPEWLLVQLPADLPHVQERVKQELGFPAVVKGNCGGSSVGVEIVRREGDFVAAFERVAAGGGAVLIERYVPGRELTAAILLGRRLPLLEIRPREGFYDYAHKYTSGASEYLVPAPVHSPLYENICADALRLHDLLGCQGLSRVDFRLDGDAYSCLEVNTIPGMTANSLVPKAAAAVGIPFGALLEDLCREALSR